jgi:tetratricopeptide (TPR) repeat protein
VLLSAGDLSGCEFPASHDNPYLEFQSKEPSEVIDYGVFVYSGTLDMKKAATLSRVQNAYQLLRAGKAPEALALVKEAVSINPQDIQAQSALGNISAAIGQNDEARKAWEAALGSARQLDPDEQASVVPELEEKLKKL